MTCEQGTGEHTVPLLVPAVNVEVSTSVPPLRVTAAVIECCPLSCAALKGFAVPFAAVPAKSQGAVFSVCLGVPVICGLSSQNLTWVTPVAGDTNT